MQQKGEAWEEVPSTAGVFNFKQTDSKGFVGEVFNYFFKNYALISMTMSKKTIKVLSSIWTNLGEIS